MPPSNLVYVKNVTVSVEALGMSWFKSAKSSILTGSISTGPNDPSVTAPPIAKLEVAKPEVVKSEIAKSELAKPEIAKPEAAKLEAIKSEAIKLELAKLETAKPVDVAPRESPKAVFDNFAKAWEKLPEKLPEKRLPPKIGFTVHASKNGEASETLRTSPTITVAKARALFKSGWRVHIADAAGRKYGPAEFDEILKFDRH
jgi:hypothetical protein